ncbi:MAG: class F sortase [Angustibacter sp.]
MTQSHEQRRRPGVLRPAAGALGLLLVVGGGALVWQQQGEPAFQSAGQVPPADGTSAVSSRSASSPRPSRSSTTPPGPESAEPAQALGAMEINTFEPTRLQMTSPQIDARVIPVGLEKDGKLVVPQDPQVVGWWSGGASPGMPVGTVVMTSHVDSARSGPGALFELRTAPIGSTIVVRGADGLTTYVVKARQRYSKDQLPAAELFAQGRQPRLVLITCGGEFDERTRHYQDNIVVVATPA